MPVSPRRANAAEFDARLNRLIGDPLRQELRDPEFLAFVDRQFNRAFPGRCGATRPAARSTAPPRSTISKLSGRR